MSGKKPSRSILKKKSLVPEELVPQAPKRKSVRINSKASVRTISPKAASPKAASPKAASPKAASPPKAASTKAASPPKAASPKAPDTTPSLSKGTLAILPTASKSSPSRGSKAAGPSTGPPDDYEEVDKFRTEVKTEDTVLNIKERLNVSYGFKVDSQQIFFNKARLEDAKTLESYGIEDGSTLQVYISGGMKAGFLHAGKVIKVRIEIHKKKGAGPPPPPDVPDKSSGKPKKSSDLYEIPECVQRA